MPALGIVPQSNIAQFGKVKTGWTGRQAIAGPAEPADVFRPSPGSIPPSALADARRQRPFVEPIFAEVRHFTM